MGRGFASESAYLDGVRAGNTIRWLENSGPRYLETYFTLAGRFFADDEHDDEAKLIDLRGHTCMLGPRHMSYASWQIVLDSPVGGGVTLKVRVDPIGRPNP
jgi:hypothetical protein